MKLKKKKGNASKLQTARTEEGKSKVGKKEGQVVDDSQISGISIVMAQ